MKHTLKTFAATVLMASSFAASAAPKEVAPDGFAPARQQFLAAATGDGGARDAAIAAFAALAAAHPSHPLLAAYEDAVIQSGGVTSGGITSGGTGARTGG